MDMAKNGERQCLLINSEKRGSDEATALWAGDKLGSIENTVRKVAEKLGGINTCSLMSIDMNPTTSATKASLLLKP
jgi:hypothetical protein